MIITISHPLTPESPMYPGTPDILIQQYKSMDAGDSANSSTVTFNSHSGTHLDFPRHFCQTAMTAKDLFPRIHSLFPAYVIDLPVPESREITCQDLESGIHRHNDARALFIRTGWGKVRAADRNAYRHDHPWISEKIPDYLRTHCPEISLFGLDQLSVSSPAHRETGRECHRQFLCHKNPILLLEDANLGDERLNTGACTLLLFPYIIGDLDGIPVTALMER